MTTQMLNCDQGNYQACALDRLSDISGGSDYGIAGLDLKELIKANEGQRSTNDGRETCREVSYSLQVGCDEYHLYQSRFYTYDEAAEVFYDLLEERRNTR